MCKTLIHLFLCKILTGIYVEQSQKQVINQKSCLNYFLLAVIKYPDKNNLRKEGKQVGWFVLFQLIFQGTVFIMVEKSRQQEKNNECMPVFFAFSIFHFVQSRIPYPMSSPTYSKDEFSHINLQMNIIKMVSQVYPLAHPLVILDSVR